MWLCVPESALEVGRVSALHKRQIRVSNFSLQCPALRPFGASVCRLAPGTTDTVASLHVEQHTCINAEEEVGISFISDGGVACVKTKTRASALKSSAHNLPKRVCVGLFGRLYGIVIDFIH